MNAPEDTYRGYRRPGPLPPGGIEPEAGETLDYISGNYRIFQYDRGHRYSTDDVLTAWCGTLWAPRVERALDLGSGIGSVAIAAAWRLPGASFVTVEAQAVSVRLAKKSIRFNGLDDRFLILEGDLRDRSLLSGQGVFDLVLGSPPYFPEGTAVAATHPQAIGARIETRGSVADYAVAAREALAPGGLFVFVFPAPQRPRAESAIAEAGLSLIRSRDVIFKEGQPAAIALLAASRSEDLPPHARNRPFLEPPLTIRDRSGHLTHEYSFVRMSFGFPPGGA